MPDKRRLNCSPLEILYMYSIWISGHITSESQWVLGTSINQPWDSELVTSHGSLGFHVWKKCFLWFYNLLVLTDSDPHTQSFPLEGRGFQGSHGVVWCFRMEKDVMMYSLWDYKARESFRVFVSLSLFVFMYPLCSHTSASAGRMQVELMVSKHPGFWDNIPTAKISTSC